VPAAKSALPPGVVPPEPVPPKPPPLEPVLAPAPAPVSIAPLMIWSVPSGSSWSRGGMWMSSIQFEHE
jgi:hypothetical protein